MTKLKLPRDLFKVAADNRVQTYLEMEAACRLHLARRIDLTFQLAQEVGDEAGWTERIQERFVAEGAVAPGVRSLRDDIKIFEVLRLPAPQGLGVPLKKVAVSSYGRMRTLAQNAEWTLANAERARALLDDPHTSEPKMRELIASELGKSPAEKLPVLRFSLPEKSIKVVEKALEEVTKDLDKRGERVPESQGELLLTIISEWKKLKKAK